MVGASDQGGHGCEDTKTLPREPQAREGDHPPQRLNRTGSFSRAMARWDLTYFSRDMPSSDAPITLQSTRANELKYHGVFGLKPTPAGPWPNIDSLQPPRTTMTSARLKAGDLEALRQAQRSFLLPRHGSYRHSNLHDDDTPSYISYDPTLGIDRFPSLSLEFPSSPGLLGHNLPIETRAPGQADHAPILL